MLNILKNMAFLLTTLVFIPYCFSATIPDMKVYCTASTPKVSFPFPGTPVIFTNQAYPEAYNYDDMTNINSYQFYYKKIDKSLRNTEYLDMVSTARVKNAKGTMLNKNIYKAANKLIINYSYYYISANSKRISHVKTVIVNNIYYSWSVQSYDGISGYAADYIFNNYSKYVDNNSDYCK